MSNIKNIKLTPIKQLIDLNGDKVNFDLNFNVTSANKVPFDALVVTQKMLDSEAPLEYKKVLEGTINGNIVSDKGVYDNYLLLLKSDTPVDCQVTIDIKDIPVNQEFFRQLEKQKNMEQLKYQQQQQQKNLQNQNTQINTENKNIPNRNIENSLKDKQLNSRSEQEKISSSKINWKLLLLILVLCIGGFALWYFYNKNLNNTKTSTQNNSLPGINLNQNQLIQNIPPVIENVPLQNVPLQNVPAPPTVSVELAPAPIKTNSIHNQILDALNNTPNETLPKLNTNLVSKINNIPIW